MDNLQRLMNWLAWFGVVPFIMALTLSVRGQSLSGISGEQIFMTYSVIICCFMAGTLWGQAVYSDHRFRRTVKVITSNLIALGVFGGLLAELADRQMLVLLATGYLITLVVECAHGEPLAGRVKSYLSMRAMVTLTVFILHCFLYASLLPE